MIEDEERRHVLYRLCDGRRHLLYVGITMRPSRRLRDHALGKDWWDEVREIYLEPHASRRLLLIAEREAVENERPRYNRAMTYGQEPSTRPFDLAQPCPVCQRESFYRPGFDRFFHLDGSDNTGCWIECTRGNITIETTNAYGRELTAVTWPTGFRL